LPDFPLYNIPKRKNKPSDYKNTIGPLHRYTKSIRNVPNGSETYKNLSFQGLNKYTKIVIFGLKIYHLATLAVNLEWFAWLITDCLLWHLPFWDIKKAAKAYFLHGRCCLSWVNILLMRDCRESWKNEQKWPSVKLTEITTCKINRNDHVCPNSKLESWN
jgi:hypothetical protein